MKTALVGVMAALALGSALPAAAQEDRPAEVRGRAVQAREAQTQGWLGIAFRYEAEGRQQRAVVTEVGRGSPAERAGVRRGDVVVRVNGGTDVEARVRALRLQPGDTVRLRVRRDGARDRDVAVVAARRPVAAWGFAPTTPLASGQRFEVRAVPGRDGVIIVNGDTVRIPTDSLMVHADSLRRRIRVLITDSLGPRLRELEGARLPEVRERLSMLDTALVRAFPEGFVFEVGRRAVAGAEFADMNPELAGYFQGAREGVLVLRVAPDSPAARAGLQGGDVVTRVNGETVRSVVELRRGVARAGREEVRLGVVRRGRPAEVRLR